MRDVRDKAQAARAKDQTNLRALYNEPDIDAPYMQRQIAEHERRLGIHSGTMEQDIAEIPKMSGVYRSSAEKALQRRETFSGNLSEEESDYLAQRRRVKQYGQSGANRGRYTYRPVRFLTFDEQKRRIRGNSLFDVEEPTLRL